MPIALTCPKCHAPHTAPDEAAGRPVRCPACRAEFPAGPAAPPAPKPARRRVLPWLLGLALVGGAGLAAYLLIGRPTPTDFTDPEGVFSARFPDRPEAKVVSQAQPLLLRWGERLYRAKAGREEYSVAVLDGLNAGDQPYGPATRDAHINGVIVLTASNADGAQLFERPAAHEGHPAREAVFVRRGDGRLTALRVLAGERHALRLAVTGPGDPDKPADFLGRAAEFFDTVHVGAGFGPPVVADPPAVSAADLAAAYRADAGAADAKYKGRWLRVSGTVREVAEGGTEFLVGAGGGAVLVRRAPAARMAVRVGRPGAEVTVTGRCRGLGAEPPEGPRPLLEGAVVARPPAPK